MITTGTVANAAASGRLFATPPIWILANLSRPNQLPIVNVVGVLVILLSAIPVYLAHRLTVDREGDSAAAAPAGAAAAGH